MLRVIPSEHRMCLMFTSSKGYAGPFKTHPALPPWLTLNYGLKHSRAKVHRRYQVSGTCDLPEGYALAYLPPNALVEHTMPEVALNRILQSS